MLPHAGAESEGGHQPAASQSAEGGGQAAAAEEAAREYEGTE